MQKNNAGFTLIELILYLGIFVIIGGLFFGVLTQIVRISSLETSGNEVTNQLNFTMQAINRLVKSSSNIEISTGSSTSTLKLRLSASASDPTCIYLSSNSILLAEGPDTLNPQNCTTDSNKIKPLTTSKVVVDSLSFKKLTFYPGHDQVLVDIQMSSANSNPTSKVARTLHSAISRVSAATFDSPLLPGIGSFDIGYDTQRWNNIYVGNLLNLGNLSTDPGTCPNGSIYYNTNSNSFRGCVNGSWASVGSSLWTATTTNMYSNVAGNVGIGTTTPAYLLDVNGSTRFGTKNGNSTYRFQRFNGTYPYAYMYPLAGTGENAGWNFSALNAGTIQEDALVIKSNSNVGVGIFNPLVKLDIKSINNGESLRFSLNEFDYHSISTKYHGGDPTQNYLGFNVEYLSNDIRRVMTLRGDGNVGIGATNPTIKFAIGENSSGINTTSPGIIGLSTFGTQRLELNGNTGLININDTMYVQGSANVGIGTQTPSSLLEIANTGYFQFSKTSAGAPLATDCDTDAERGRMSIDTTNNRLYICNGATRLWDYILLAN